MTVRCVIANAWSGAECAPSMAGEEDTESKDKDGDKKPKKKKD